MGGALRKGNFPSKIKTQKKRTRNLFKGLGKVNGETLGGKKKIEKLRGK